MRRPALFALVLLSLLSACGKEAPKPAGRLHEVEVLTLQEKPLAMEQELPGRTIASQESDVRPQVDGVLVKRLFEEGESVHAGQPLFQIEPALYQAAVNQAQANLKTAEAAAVTARLRAQRMQALGGEQLAARQDVDDAIASGQQAAAAVQAAQASLDTARTRLGFATVTAPIAGRIGRALFTPGALVTSGQANPLARIQQVDPMNVDITQSSNEYLALRRAIADGGVQATTAAVRLRLSDGSEYPLPGTLEFADIDVQQETGSITLRARFPNPAGQLLPGMYVRAQVGRARSGRRCWCRSLRWTAARRARRRCGWWMRAARRSCACSVPHGRLATSGWCWMASWPANGWSWPAHRGSPMAWRCR